MKSLALILTIVLSIFNISQPNNLETEKQKSVESNNEITTYYLIRHAEKDRSDATEKDPLLTNQGTARAKNWAKVFKDVPFQMVYSTNYNRTKATAQPTATSKELELNIYDPNKMYDEKFQKETKGKTVLVVGHSNTTPAFVNAILKEKKYTDIPDNDNGYLFIVTLNADNSVSSQVLHIN
ncbi:histidine phosphatase superfamily protein (branch 1) [Gillisia mitskevichiae]|uniref:Histidine phosphatase superfamily protein (Branch 1) n=1 Tax=Gillisia mitskevichiae TaxID=270921 RepID=A0A495PVL9_9FLAO|nr:histidine phosphatase family protein [Gillisia mitskevichiae]RKS53582.1 histidine phosphatase superfamily protein (branch 1) [Gillisia mitskevichiae]